MIGIEWEVATSLTTTAGTLNFNTFPGLWLDPGNCSATKDIRAPKDPVPQGDGDVIHHRWLTGYVYDITAHAFTNEDTCSPQPEARLLFEELGLHLTAMLNNAGRYCWLPTGYGDTRALDEARWFGGAKVSLGSGGIWQVQFQIDSPFPYAIDLTQTTPTITTFGSITNNGNSPFYPVIQVQGPIGSSAGQGTGNGFAVINGTLNKGMVYDAGRPGAVSFGGGHYAEIDTYNGTIYLDGNGADLSAGIDPLLTNLEDPFTLIPGVNNISTSNSVAAKFLVNNAWA